MITNIRTGALPDRTGEQETPIGECATTECHFDY